MRLALTGKVKKIKEWILDELNRSLNNQDCYLISSNKRRELMFRICLLIMKNKILV